MAAGKVPLIFRLYKGDTFVREERLTLPVIKVGKLSSSHLRLDDESVSRMHAVIEVTGPGDISIIDLGSTKGTFVNGQKVNKAKLQAGDSIVVGDTRIDVAIGAEEGVAVGGPGMDEDVPTRINPGMADAAAAMRNDGGFAPPPAPMMSAPAAPSFGTTPPPMGGAPNFGTTPPPMGMPRAGAPAQPPGIRAPAGFPGSTPFQTNVAPAAFQQMQAESIDDLGGARAVEVAAMMGDSVVQVKHVMNARGGKVSANTITFLAVGAACLLLAVVAFVMSYRGASANAAALTQWIADKLPRDQFRAEIDTLVYDWMMFGGMSIGLTLVVMGLGRLRRERESTPWFRIGQAPEVEFATLSSPSASFPLVAPVGDDFVFNFASGMEGELLMDGQSTSLSDLQAQGRARPSSTAPGALELAIPAKARIRVRSGVNTFLLSSVVQPRRQATPLFANLETQVLAFFAGSAAVHVGFVILLDQLTDDQLMGDNDDDMAERIAMDSMNTAQDDPPPEIPPEEENDSNEESGGSGQAMALDEGKMGKKDSDRAEGRYKMAKTQEREQLARQQAIDAARTAGIMGSTALQNGGAFASITGTGDTSSGFDDLNVYGGLLGDEAGEMNGGFGYGRSGFGPGGGGTGWGTIGTGRYGTIGQGSGNGPGYGIGGGRGPGGGRTAAVPTVKIGEPSGSGELDKAIIRRYIKRNIQKITYCYEKQLLAKSGLAGTVSTSFLIAADGTVQASSASGVDGEVSSCVAGVIKGIEFPKPKGGAGVRVNYPFIFRPTGG